MSLHRYKSVSNSQSGTYAQQSAAIKFVANPFMVLCAKEVYQQAIHGVFSSESSCSFPNLDESQLLWHLCAWHLNVEVAACRSGRRFFGMVGSHRGGRPSQADRREWRILRLEARNLRERGSPLTAWTLACYRNQPSISCHCDTCNGRK